MDRKAFVLFGLFLVTGVLYYVFIVNSASSLLEATVVRVIDGDTLELVGGKKVRLIGVNTPEKSFSGYDSAKDFLLFLENKTVFLEVYGFDKYGRILAHAFYGSSHINEEILLQGLGTLYYYEPDKYFDTLNEAEESARENQNSIWQVSPLAECITLLELRYDEEGERCTNGELLRLENVCPYDLEIIIKDDATHTYKEIVPAVSVFEKSFSCIFNDAGDSLYIYDSDGLLLFYRYP